MEFDRIIYPVLIGLAIFLALRIILYRWLLRTLERRIVEKDYMDLVNSPKFQVRGKYD